MKLFFAGDLAWPEAEILAFNEVQALCAGGSMVANLEGGIISKPAEQSTVNNEFKFNIYSHPSVMQTLAQLNVVACGLANNHISDYVGSIENSKRMLAEQGIAAFGSREHPSCTFTVGGREVVAFAACSPLPEPRSAADADHALVFDPPAALATLRQLRHAHPQALLVAFMHWGYELAKYPQPADREWARRAIDAGVDLVIGHHPHLVQGFETYGRGAIAYSLGNLLLPQVPYRGRKLHYKTPAVCEELLIELDGDTLRSHWLRYDPATQSVRHTASHIAAEDAALRERTPFAGMSDADYRHWFASTGRHGSEGKRASTVLWSYEGWRGADTALKLSYLKGRSLVRKLAMGAGLHKPYNW